MEYISKHEVYTMMKDLEAAYIYPPVKEAYATAARRIAQMLATDVQPVKHGRWSECYTDTHHYSGICSVCGKASIKSLAESLYAFCPKCGARMDGEHE